MCCSSSLWLQRYIGFFNSCKFNAKLLRNIFYSSLNYTLVKVLHAQFISRIKDQLEDAQIFFETLEGNSPSAVRLHPKKGDINAAWIGDQVAWNPDGYYVQDRPNYSRLPAYHAGMIYPMEASSMFLDFVVRQLDLKADSNILDACAAPGGKTLILNDRYPNHLLVSNEVDRKRSLVLKENSVRWGTTNHIVVDAELADLVEAGHRYGLVVVDAPCSGEGLFRKDTASRNEWTPERASGCAVRQKSVVEDCVMMVDEGGYLIYSTCTYNPEENEAIVRYLMETHGGKPVQIEVPSEWNIEVLDIDGAPAFQFWPHRLSGEGFFICALCFEGSTSRTSLGKQKFSPYQLGQTLGDIQAYRIGDLVIGLTEKERTWLSSWRHNVVKRGLLIGELKGDQLVFSYDLAMSCLDIEVPSVELSEEDASRFLRGEALQLEGDKGFVLLTFNGMRLGFGKSIGNRINNLYPKHLRIRA